MPRWLQIVLCLVLFGAVMRLDAARAQEEPDVPPEVKAATLRILNNFAHEHATCVAYYVVAAKCFSGPMKKDKETYAKMSQVGAEMINRGREWTKRAGLEAETFIARIELETQAMTSLMKDNCGNISLAIRQHGMSCKALVEKPEERIKTLADEIYGERVR